MVKKIFVEKVLTDIEVKNLKGEWIDESYIKHPIVNEDCDVYYNDNGIYKLLLKFRKNVISEDLLKIGWDSYKNLAKASRGRGAAAGPIDKEGQYWSKNILVNTKKWATSYLTQKGVELYNSYINKDIKDIYEIANNLLIKYEKNIEKNELILMIIKKQKGISNMLVNNQVASMPIGYFEESKKMNKKPCRLTHFTKTNYDDYINGLSFIQKIDSLFKQLIPESYKKQYERACKKNNYRIHDTSFSTITINRNFRTALHKDAGDYKEGFGNLTVIERGKYHGGYTVFPQFGIGIDLRNKDFVAMDVHQWHSNTKIYETKEDKFFNDKLDIIYKDNPKIGTAGIYTKYTRLSFVCYLREKMIECN